MNSDNLRSRRETISGSDFSQLKVGLASARVWAILLASGNAPSTMAVRQVFVPSSFVTTSQECFLPFSPLSVVQRRMVAKGLPVSWGHTLHIGGDNSFILANAQGFVAGGFT